MDFLSGAKFVFCIVLAEAMVESCRPACGVLRSYAQHVEVQSHKIQLRNPTVN